MIKIIVWYNPKKDSYKWKKVCDVFDRYYVGFTNQYGHIVVVVIDLYKELIYKMPLRKKSYYWLFTKYI